MNYGICRKCSNHFVITYEREYCSNKYEGTFSQEFIVQRKCLASDIFVNYEIIDCSHYKEKENVQ
jgi:hypothetical protein